MKQGFKKVFYIKEAVLIFREVRVVNCWACQEFEKGTVYNVYFCVYKIFSGEHANKYITVRTRVFCQGYAHEHGYMHDSKGHSIYYPYKEKDHDCVYYVIRDKPPNIAPCYRISKQDKLKETNKINARLNKRI